MNILLLRPEPQAAETEKKLVKLGFKITKTPCQNIAMPELDTHEDKVVPDDFLGAIIVSSLNGVHYGLAQVENKKLTIFCIGDKTAEAASELGFEEIYSADGNGDSLFEMILHRWDPQGGPLIHLSGDEVANDFAGLLNALGYLAERRVVYKMQELTSPSTHILEQIKNNNIDAVLFYSAKSATIFNGWVESAGLKKSLKNILAVAMSDRIAQYLNGPWKEIEIAETQNEDAIVNILQSRA